MSRNAPRAEDIAALRSLIESLEGRIADLESAMDRVWLDRRQQLAAQQMAQAQHLAPW